jgi:hypothetical protein
MLCALLIFDTADFYRPLTEISPWFDAVTYDVAETRATLEAQTTSASVTGRSSNGHCAKSPTTSRTSASIRAAE